MDSEDTRDVSNPLISHDLNYVKACQAVFAKEAINFLLRNAHIWIEYPKDFVSRFTYSKRVLQFDVDKAKAIVVIAYLHRMEYRARYRQPVNLETDLRLYEDCVRSYSFPNKNYIYDYLSWTAFIFDLTMYCYKKGYDYTERGKQFIAEYPYIEDFCSNVALSLLIFNSQYIEWEFHEKVPITSHDKDKCKDKDIVSFVKRLENIERRDRYSNNRWLITPDLELDFHKPKLSAKYSVVSEYDSRRLTAGYMVVLKKSTENSTQEISPKSPKVQVSETQKFNSGEKDDLGKDLTSQKDKISEVIAVDHDFAASKTEPSYLQNTDNSNSVFIIHQRFLNKRNEYRKDSKYKRGLKICSTSMNSDVLAPNLSEILDESIDNKNYREIGKLGNSVYAVIPPGRVIDEEDTQIIVLDSSSEEEEDYSCIKSSREIADIIWPTYLEPNGFTDLVLKFFKCAPSKHTESESKESVFGMTTEQKSKKLKISEAKSIKSSNQLLYKEISTKIPSEQRMLVSSEITEAVSKKSGTVVNPEQKPFVIIKSTGAIHKVKKTDLKKRLTKRSHTNNASGNSEDSD